MLRALVVAETRRDPRQVPGFEVRFCVPPTDGAGVERVDGWMDVGID
jgi:hypothetical protein